ncbi:MAG: glycosyltransferase family 1 protein [Acidobacteriota bacterium]
MRIAFDGTTLTPGRTGVGYYTEHLLAHLADEVVQTGDELIVLSNQAVETDRPMAPHVRVHAGHRFPVRLGWMQFRAARAISAVGADVAHFTNGMMPAGVSVPTVVTVHDMSLQLYPGCHPVRRLLLNRPLMRTAIRRAGAIVTVSHSTRRDLLRLHPEVDPGRVVVVHEAAGPGFSPIDDAARLADVRARYGLPARFLLYVGTIEPRKNLPRLVSAFAEARAAGLRHHLVCAGPYGWSSRSLAGHIRRLGVEAAVHFTGYLRAADLPALYNLSEFFVFPSLYEGFGLPVVEAMACGVPVITSNTSSLAEIAGDAALTVDPTMVEALGSALHRLGSDAALRADLSARGLARARAFSWAQAARAMLGAYRRAAGVEASATDAVVDAAPPAIPVPSASPERSL